MIAVIFEVELAEGCREKYLAIAASLKETLENIDGFVSVERFQSISTPDKLLSLSFFEDEAAVAQWRQSADHKLAQQHGRRGIFSNYRLRVAHVKRDYGLNDRDDAPTDSLAFHAQR